MSGPPFAAPSAPEFNLQQVLVYGVDFTLDASFNGVLVTLTGSSEITVPSNVNNSLPVGFSVDFGNLASGTVTFTDDGDGASIISLSSHVTLGAAGAIASIRKVASDVWLLGGSLVA